MFLRRRQDLHRLRSCTDWFFAGWILRQPAQFAFDHFLQLRDLDIHFLEDGGHQPAFLVKERLQQVQGAKKLVVSLLCNFLSTLDGFGCFDGQFSRIKGHDGKLRKTDPRMRKEGTALRKEANVCPDGSCQPVFAADKPLCSFRACQNDPSSRSGGLSAHEWHRKSDEMLFSLASQGLTAVSLPNERGKMDVPTCRGLIARLLRQVPFLLT